MKLLEGKTALITGVANDYSIAWGIAKALYAHGAELAFTYQNERLKEKMHGLVKQFNPRLVTELDVTKDEDVARVGQEVLQTYGQVDIFLHSMAFVPKEDLHGEFAKISRSGFALANDISAYSLINLTNALLPAFEAAGGGSIIYLTYIGGEYAISTYGMAGVTKAALEISGKYLAQSLGERKIRVNGISAGPIKTLAARGIKNFSGLQQKAQDFMPLKGEMTPDDVAGTAVFLGSDLSKSITGEIIHVDNGFHCVRG
ncbi:enoyl-[acyl-carrier-protein] reductase [Candidatus Termititenax persephonae]|uniref:Enoyl-[acyl-carrier-protein] reductase [NADH] n=1 Tax=Candidatus Termititenax persephonae TaxID=2218525 RepID=A0A388TJL6_9BACT|nr:enoyl-[acyl-carrier-protein] reductase [Candidatus Termititenax persephonae]